MRFSVSGSRPGIVLAGVLVGSNSRHVGHGSSQPGYKPATNALTRSNIVRACFALNSEKSSSANRRARRWVSTQSLCDAAPYNVHSSRGDSGRDRSRCGPADPICSGWRRSASEASRGNEPNAATTSGRRRTPRVDGEAGLRQAPGKCSRAGPGVPLWGACDDRLRGRARTVVPQTHDRTVGVRPNEQPLACTRVVPQTRRRSVVSTRPRPTCASHNPALHASGSHRGLWRASGLCTTGRTARVVPATAQRQRPGRSSPPVRRGPYRLRLHQRKSTPRSCRCAQSSTRRSE